MKKEVLDILNEQLNNEFESAHIYLAMSAYCSDIGLNGFENWFLIQYQEESAHALKLMNYIQQRGEKAVITGFKNPTTEYASILEVCEKALQHEKFVSGMFDKIATLASTHNDHATYQFAQWYINEQVEEEDNFNTLINKIKLVKDAGLFLLDQECATRVFTPIQ